MTRPKNGLPSFQGKQWWPNNPIFHLRFFPAPTHCPPPREAFEKFLEAKTHAGYRKAYLTSLRQIVGDFIAKQNSLTGGVETVKEYLASKNWGPAALRGNIGRLASFFTYCVKQGWIEKNPCDSIELPKIADKIPFTWSNEQKQKILQWTLENRPSMLGVAVLEVLLGVRPHETLRLDKNSVQIELRKVIIDAAASKVWKRRIIPINDEAYQWLKLAESKNARFPVSQSTRKRWIKALRSVLGYSAWPQDSLRHTAATNMLRETENAGKVARWLGNSERILLKNYADI